MKTLEKYCMIKNPFGNIQCLICYLTFKTGTEYVIKRHCDHFHNFINKLNEKEKENLFQKNKKLYLEKLKQWCEGEEICVTKPVSKLKKEISSLISLEIVKKGRPFCDGIFLKQLLNKILQRLNFNTQLIESLPLSTQTVGRRTIEIGTCVEADVREKLNNCEFFSICLDESLDVKDLCQLIICIRCVDSEYNICESMLTLETFYGNVSGKLLFDVIAEKVLSIVDINKFAGVCTDGANVMLGKYNGLIGQFKKHGFAVNNFHCIIHQTALASKFLNNDPAMKTAEEIINKIRGGHQALTHRKFVNFLKNKKAVHYDLKMFTEVRWLSRGQCLNVLYDLREEVLVYLETEKMENNLVQALRDKDFILDLAFLADTTSMLNELNLELQGKEHNICDLSKIIFNFKTKLFLLLSQIDSGDFSNFPKTSNICVRPENYKRQKYLDIFESLFYNFQDRFQDLETVQPKIDLFENPFRCDLSKHEFNIQSELLILRSEVNVPDKSNIKNFWKDIDGAIYPELKKNSYKCLSFFTTTYLCEQIFSDLKFICSKQRNALTSHHLKNILLIRNCHKSINMEDFISVI